jgi:hypothetical protein
MTNACGTEPDTGTGGPDMEEVEVAIERGPGAWAFNLRRAEGACPVALACLFSIFIRHRD